MAQRNSNRILLRLVVAVGTTSVCAVASELEAPGRLSALPHPEPTPVAFSTADAGGAVLRAGAPTVRETVSRSFTVVNRGLAPLLFDQKVARAFTIVNHAGTAAIIDRVLSRSITVVNRAVTMTSSRSFTVMNRVRSVALFDEVVARSFSVVNHAAEATLFAEKVPRSFSVLNLSTLADIDGNGSADLSDFQLLGGCLTGPIPLLIAVAAGIIVTRAGGKGDLGEEVLEQLWGRARPLGISAGVLGTLALVPGLPHLAFGCLAAGLGLAAYRVSLREEEEKESKEKPEEITRGPDRPTDLLKPPEPLELEIGYGLIDLVDPKRDGELVGRIRSLRREFAESTGFPVPLVHIRDNLQLQAEEYRIRVRGVLVAQARVFPDQVLAIAPPGGGPALPGHPTTDPAFGLPAFWVRPDMKEQAQTSGYTVVDAASAIVTHLTETIRRHAPDLLGRQQVQEMLDSVSATQPKLVSELVPDPLPLGGVQKVLQNLLREGVGIRDLPTVLEALADYASKTKDTELLTELVRERLAPHISAMLAPDGKLGVLVLAPELERTIASSIQRTEHGSVITLEAAEIAKVVGAVQSAVQRVSSLHPNPGVLCSPDVRPHLRRMIERFLPRCPIVTANELASGVQLESLGTIALAS